MMISELIDPKYPPPVRLELAVKRMEERTLKAFKRIAEDREIIKQRLNKDITHSKLNSTQTESDDPKHPLEIIHEEGIWEDILDFLVDTEDIRNAYHSCVLFHQLLERKVVNKLFPQVLSILRNRHYLCYDEALDKNSILNLRLISRTWKHTVDRIFFEDRYTCQNWHIKCPTSSPLRCPITTSDKFAEIISSLPESQILFTRELTIVDPDEEDLDDDEAMDAFYAGVINLLELCGDSIWALIYQTRRSFSAAYSSVREWCTFLPNIKSLRVNNLRDFNQDYAYTDEVVRTEIVILLETMRANPFPSLPFLMHYEEQDMPCLFSAMILSANSDIKSVMVSEINFDIGQVIRPMRLDRLSLYKFHYQTSTYFMTNPWQNPYYWPLKKITLRNIGGFLQCKVAPLFSFLKIYKNCLEELEVDLDVPDDPYNHEYLELPNLRMLRWRLCITRKLSFIAPLGSLEILKLIIDNTEDVSCCDSNFSPCQPSSCTHVQIKGYNKVIGESGFECVSWSEFPSLKEISFEDLQGITLKTYLRP